MRADCLTWVTGLSLVALSSSHALAQASLPLELEWRAPPECPQGGAVRAELERIVVARSGVALPTLRARAIVERRGSGYALVLSTEQLGERGERTLRADDCESLVRSATLVLALAFGAGRAPEPVPGSASGSALAQSQLTAAEPAPATASPPTTASELAPARDTAGGTNTSDAPRAAPRLAFAFGGGLTLGLLPAAAFQFSAGVELDLDRVSVALRLGAWPGVSTQVTPQVDASFSGFTLGLLGCWQLKPANSTLGLCASARAAALIARASGALMTGSATAPWYGLGAGIAWTWPRDAALRVRLAAALTASLDRPRFVIEGLEQVHRLPLFAPEFELALVF